MNEKTSINSICLNLWAPTANLLQGLTVLQQRVYQMKFRDVCEVKKRLVQNWSTFHTAVNEWRKRLLACVRIVGQHFKQFYGRQLKNGQLNEMSATLSERWQKCVLHLTWIRQSYRIGQKGDISLVVQLCFPQVVQKQTLGEVGNWMVIW